MDRQTDKAAWNKSNHNIFENFALDLNGFTDAGSYPPDASQDVKYGLELQNKRLQDKKLKMKYGIVPRGLLQDSEGYGKEWSDGRYICRIDYRTCCLSRSIYRDNKKLYEKDQNSIFYQMITDVKDPSAVADELYSCPNCAAVSKIAVLQSGCPYCGTFFEMDELYPKVTNYFFVKDNGYTEKEIKRSIGKVMLPCIAIAIIAYVLYFLLAGSPDDGGGAAHIVTSIISGILAGTLCGAIFGYMIWAIIKIVSLFVEAGKSIPMLVNTAGSSGRFESFMKQYSPEFSYEYFSDKVVSMIKTIIFSERPDDLPYYEGEALGSKFHDVVESLYSGAVALKQYRIEGDYCYISTDVYLENLYDNGGRIHAKKDTIRVELRKNIRRSIDINFSIERIQCKSCGASFNAARRRNCPHCGTRYEIGDDDWIITRLS